MRNYPVNLADEQSSIVAGSKQIILGSLGINEDGTIGDTTNMQLILVQSTVWTVTDENDPLDRPAGTTITSKLYAAQGTFAGDLDYSTKVSGGVVDTAVGRFSVFGEIASTKDSFTEKTSSDLLTVFQQTGGDNKHKAFYVGTDFSEDTVDEMTPVDIVRVVVDSVLDCVVVTVRKKESL